ncbi:hypothetical protein N9B39_03485 [bacterium]|nr:hypothetical protein [bacterium]
MTSLEMGTFEYPAQEYPAQEYPAQEYPAQEYPAQECPAQWRWLRPVVAVCFVFIGLVVTICWPWVASVPLRTAGCLSWHIAVNSHARQLAYQILSVCTIICVTRYTPSVTRSALTCTQ